MSNNGICIGGPLDGKRVSHYDTIWRADKEPESLGAPIFSKAALEAAMNETREVVTYYFTSSTYWHGDKSVQIGFWVLKDMTILDAFSALAERYQEPRRHRGLLKRAGKLIDRLYRSLGCPMETLSETREVLDLIRKEIDE